MITGRQLFYTAEYQRFLGSKAIISHFGESAIRHQRKYQPVATTAAHVASLWPQLVAAQ